MQEVARRCAARNAESGHDTTGFSEERFCRAPPQRRGCVQDYVNGDKNLV